MMCLSTEIFEQVLESLGVKKQDKIILGISGGADSVVAAHLLCSANYQVQLAHVNYGLRGEESDDDQRFVESFADRNHIQLHVLRIDADKVFGKDQSAIQQRARDLRYEWFNELKEKKEAHWIMVAHHLGDQTETMLHQFIRGGSLKSLTGMSSVRDAVIRPLLRFTKEEIRGYANRNNLNWRNDSSNESDGYTRNFIRHQVVPLLKEINPSLESVLAERGSMIQRTSDYVDAKLAEDLNRFLKDDSGLRISLEISSPGYFPDLLLWHWLEPFGVSSAAMPEVIKLLASQTGSHMEFANWFLWKEHDALFLQERIHVEELTETIIQALGDQTVIQGLSLTECAVEDVFFDKGNTTMFLDAAAFTWPVVVRGWQTGDRFVPLGFGHEKKLSDFFMQEKIAAHARLRYPILLSANKIIAIAGLRIDDSVRVGPSTSRVLRIDFVREP